MCERCERLFIDATGALDELVLARTNVGERKTPAGNAIATTKLLMNCIDDEHARHDWDVQQICITLAAAVERLAALEKSGITT